MSYWSSLEVSTQSVYILLCYQIQQDIDSSYLQWLTFRRGSVTRFPTPSPKHLGLAPWFWSEHKNSAMTHCRRAHSRSWTPLLACKLHVPCAVAGESVTGRDGVCKPVCEWRCPVCLLHAREKWCWYISVLCWDEVQFCEVLNSGGKRGVAVPI